MAVGLAIAAVFRQRAIRALRVPFISHLRESV
jgi:hypothetical protein